MKPHLLVLNPNSTPAMTRRVAQQVAHTFGVSTDLSELTLQDGPSVIDSQASFDAGAAAALHGLPQYLARHPQITGVLLACFGDPGLEALRLHSGGRPVQGLAEAAMALAAARRQRFAILTCGPAWVGLLRQRAQAFGHGAWLGGVYALPVNGLQLSQDPERWRRALQAAARQAESDGAQALILGGAALAGLAHWIDSALPLIDSIEAAARALLLPAAAPE